MKEDVRTALTDPRDNGLFIGGASVADGWSSRAKMGYLGVCAQCITSDWVIKTWRIALDPFPTPHTAERYEQLLLAVWDAWELRGPLLEDGTRGVGPLRFLVTDAASTMKSLATALSPEVFTHYCTDHNLHNAWVHSLQDLVAPKGKAAAAGAAEVAAGGAGAGYCRRWRGSSGRCCWRGWGRRETQEEAEQAGGGGEGDGCPHRYNDLGHVAQAALLGDC